ncbi:MAG: T9SS type A sorting domain-containing protein [Chloroherpetonaceae bacterium]|nr:T9SS type A sorting domain-containing protein [Chloroherpetonaceae bacterium]
MKIILFISALLLLAIRATAQFISGQAANVVLGQPNFSTGGIKPFDSTNFGGPRGIAIDPASGKLFVATGHRILRFSSQAAMISGSSAEAVFGQPNFLVDVSGFTASKMSVPYGVAVDRFGNLYVADSENHRVLRFMNAATAPSGSAAVIAFGQPNLTSRISNNGGLSASSMSFPTGVVVDSLGNLYVCDSENNRVLRFANAATAVTGAAASVALGQPNLTSGTANNGGLSASTLSQPYSVAVDGSGNLYVVDSGNSRVLRFANAASVSTGAAASIALGQPDFFSGSFNNNLTSPTANTMSYPFGVAVNSSGNLYVGDSENNRVLLFVNAATAVTGAAASIALGQPNLTSGTANNGGLSASTMNIPYGVALDPSGNLYVADQNNNRVLRFNNSISNIRENQKGSPQTYALHHNYPNPFNPSTTIGYQLPVTGDVSLKVYDVLGREVATLVNASQAAGSYQANFNASNVSSGVYFYRLEVSSASSQGNLFVQTKKMVLVK